MKVKLNKRAYIIIAVAVVIIAIIIAIVASKGKNGDFGGTGTKITMEGNSKIITGDKLSEKKQFEGLEFSNVSFKVNDKTTEIFADVTNTTSQTSEPQHIDFNVFNKKGEKIQTIGGYVRPLEPGATIQISTLRISEEVDSQAYNIEIVPQDTSNSFLPESSEDNTQTNA